MLKRPKGSGPVSGTFRRLPPIPIEQYHVIRFAIEVVRRSEGEPTMAKGRCLELICADYLAGARNEVK